MLWTDLIKICHKDKKSINLLTNVALNMNSRKQQHGFQNLKTIFKKIFKKTKKLKNKMSKYLFIIHVSTSTTIW